MDDYIYMYMYFIQISNYIYLMQLTNNTQKSITKCYLNQVYLKYETHTRREEYVSDCRGESPKKNNC